MTFEEFAEKLLNDKRLVLELAHTALVAQSKIKGQLASGAMEKSRTEYDSLIKFFEGVEEPFNWTAKDWVSDFFYNRGMDA